MRRSKPTRRDLLIVIGKLQDLIGEARGTHENDRRPPHAFERAQDQLREAHELCVDARSFDPPIEVDKRNKRGWP